MDKQSDDAWVIYIIMFAGLVYWWKVVLAIIFVGLVIYIATLIFDEESRTLGIILAAAFSLFVVIGYFHEPSVDQTSEQKKTVHVKKHKNKVIHEEPIEKVDEQVFEATEEYSKEEKYFDETVMNERTPEERLEGITGEKLN